MSIKMPNSKRNLDIAINRIFGVDTNPLQIRTLIANTVVGQMLPNGVIKGGCALKMRYGDKITRFTRDLDTARADDLDIFLDQLETALKAGWSGFTGRVVRKEPAKPTGIPGEYIMQPFEVKLAYNSKSWITVPLEIGHDEIGDTIIYDNYISQEILSVFETLGFPAPNPIPLLQIHYQVAQKLHALSTPKSERAHDLIDLQVIEKLSEIDYSQVKIACERLFKFRKQQSWPIAIVKRDGWDTLYESHIDELDVIKNVDDAIIWCNNLIDKINGVDYG